MKSPTHATVAHASAPDASPLIQVSGALLGIIVLILAGAWLVKRLGISGANTRGIQGLKVSASASLGPRERVVVVNVEDARLVLGVTANQVTLLHTLPPASPEPAPTSSPDFSSLMKNVLQRPRRS
ncbi:flagellar biosynthetic protein FliO [Pseudocitrobacter cyperus]|uniref:Flagellar protein n=1 Tax=Pseudocitrobacter cyperus TaxID=3112843 RepID=A0ABV0HNQ5_9ENTR